jgi:hypothetical protein
MGDQGDSMGQRNSLFLLTAATIIGSTPLLAAEDAAFGKDLQATIALNGMACDQVVDARRNGDSDYTATCKNGSRYHVFVSAQGRVVVQKQ